MSTPHHGVVARDIMSSPAVTITEDATLAEAGRLMLEHKFNCLPVVDAEGRLVGMLTERAFFPSQRRVPFSPEPITWLIGSWVGDMENLEAALRDARDKPVSEGMVRARPTVAEDTPLPDIAELLMRENVRHVAVVRGEEVVGVISPHDMLRVFVPR